ncbi:MAG: hypothetical protein ABF868_11055 [Sporolactobacillus sp.]
MEHFSRRIKSVHRICVICLCHLSARSGQGERDGLRRRTPSANNGWMGKPKNLETQCRDKGPVGLLPNPYIGQTRTLSFNCFQGMRSLSAMLRRLHAAGRGLPTAVKNEEINKYAR